MINNMQLECEKMINELNKKERDQLFYKIKIKEEILEMTQNGTIIYQSQQETSLCIVDKIGEGFNIVNVVGPCQSGKTGIQLATIDNIFYKTKIEHIFVLICISSNDVRDQMKSRMPESLSENIFHRGELQNFTTKFNKIKNKQNILLIMDETHLAAKEKQTISKTLKDIGLQQDVDYLKENNIIITQFTATPDGTIYEASKINAAKVLITPPENYVGGLKLLHSGRIQQFEDLTIIDNVKEIKILIDNKFIEPMYSIFRLPTTKDKKEEVIHNFRKIFDNDNYIFKEYDQTTDIDINDDLLKKNPDKHTFIFIKELLRCSNTLVKTYLGILYERYVTKPNDSTINQGLAGRGFGYDDNGKFIIFTNVDSIKKYGKLMEVGYEDKSIKWNSNTTKTRKGKDLYIRATFNNPALYNINDNVNEDANIRLINDYHFKTFKDYNNMLNFHHTLFEGSGPRNPQQNLDGFYEKTIHGDKKVWSIEEISNGVWKGQSNNAYHCYPCYSDVTDKTTLEWVFIYPKN